MEEGKAATLVCENGGFFSSMMGMAGEGQQKIPVWVTLEWAPTYALKIVSLTQSGGEYEYLKYIHLRMCIHARSIGPKFLELKVKKTNVNAGTGTGIPNKKLRIAGDPLIVFEGAPVSYVAVDMEGNVYFSDETKSSINKISADSIQLMEEDPKLLQEMRTITELPPPRPPTEG